MFNKLRTIFKNSIVNNNRGSSLSVSLIIITILTFTIANITSVSVNLAGSTTVLSEGIADDNTAKGLIIQTISEFQVYLETDTFVNYLNTQRDLNGCIESYNVCVSDVTEAGQTDNSRKFRFSYMLENGTELVKYLFFSTGGSNVGAGGGDFIFSIGSNEDIILNGGLYTDVDIFSKDVRVSTSALYFNNPQNKYKTTNKNRSYYPNFSLGNSKVYYSANYDHCDRIYDVCYNVLQNNESFPYKVKENNFLTLEEATNPSITSGVVGIETSSTDFFDGFELDDFIIEEVLTGRLSQSTIDGVTSLDELIDEIYDNFEYGSYTESWAFVPNTGTGGSGNEVVNWFISFMLNILWNIWGEEGQEEVWEEIVNETFPDLGGTYALISTIYNAPSTPFIGIPTDSSVFDGTSGHILDYSAVYNGNLEIRHDLTINSGEILVVMGDLTINNRGTSNISIIGDIYCTGNVYFTGNDVDIEGSIIAGSYHSSGTPIGGSVINFDLGQGIYTPGSKGFTLIAKDSIYIDSIFEDHSPVEPMTDIIRAFIYTDESIIIDAVNSQLNLQGSLLARAKSATADVADQSEWYIRTKNNSNEIVTGIMINSYQGYVKDNGWLSGDKEGENNWNRFKMSELAGTLEQNFNNLPAFDFSITVTPDGEGSYIYETSEFIYE